MHSQRNHSARRRFSSQPIVHRNERLILVPSTGGDAERCVTLGEAMLDLSADMQSTRLASVLRTAAASLIAWGRRG